MNKKRLYFIIVSLIIIISFSFYGLLSNREFKKVIFKTEEKTAYKEGTVYDKNSVYDVILFWGQSNMVGNCGKPDTSTTTYAEQVPDSRYDYTDSTSVSEFSAISGIDESFLSNSEKMCYVRINQVENSVFEYKYSTDSLEEINSETTNCGEYLRYDESTETMYSQTGKTGSSIEKSLGTNLIPAFCKTYCEETKHGVIVVSAANGGEDIDNFLPKNDPNYGDENNQMIYEAMKTKYLSAVSYLERNNYKIGNKVTVCFQRRERC